MITPSGFQPYRDSKVTKGGTSYELVRQLSSNEKYLLINGDTEGFEGERIPDSNLFLCKTNHHNAVNLRKKLEWLNPQCLGIKKSAGLGDRLGLATPGHVRAIRGTGIAPIFAQQSVRENMRTRRTPMEIIDDAMWGIFQEGWQDVWGADADHLKHPEQIEPFIRAGYTFFTIDPGDFVDDAAAADTAGTLKSKFSLIAESSKDPRFSWETLRRRYLDTPIQLGNLQLTYDELTLLRCVVKLGKAIQHIVTMNSHIQKDTHYPFEIEISIDETDTPTTPHEHYFIVQELLHQHVNFVSLAPRFSGRFEKGVDFIGDLGQFTALLKQHCEIRDFFNSYKLSLHSGSDKFSLYPLFGQYTDGYYHVKTAGTSYLEAIRIIAQTNPALFDHMLASARMSYEEDKRSYHVSASLLNVPHNTENITDRLKLLDQFDTRQVFHVTFGSILNEYKTQILNTLKQHEEAYYETLIQHFRKHFNPLLGIEKQVKK